MYTIVDIYGAPLRTLEVPTEMLALNIKEGETAVTVEQSGDWWDGSAWQTKPPQPSKYHTWDWPTHTWIDARTDEQKATDAATEIEDARTAQWSAIKRNRDAAEFGGFTWDGSIFDSDAESQTRIIGSAQLAQIVGSGFSIDWTLQNNTVRTLSAQDMVNVGVAMGQHIATVHAQGRALRTQLEAATTMAEINAISWA